MASSLIIIIAALALGGIFAALWGVIRISRRLEDLEAQQAELRDGIDRVADPANQLAAIGLACAHAEQGTVEAAYERSDQQHYLQLQ